MGKVIRLTENDLSRIIRGVVKEQKNEGNKEGKLPPEKNDIIKLKYVDDDDSPIPIGTIGLVRGSSKDEMGQGYIVHVSWLTGIGFGILTEYDDWEIIKKGSDLSREEYLDFIIKYDEAKYNKD
jgi:hypothetical protein